MAVRREPHDARNGAHVLEHNFLASRHHRPSLHTVVCVTVSPMHQVLLYSAICDWAVEGYNHHMMVISRASLLSGHLLVTCSFRPAPMY